MGIEALKDVSQVLKMQWISRIISDSSFPWACLARLCVARNLNSSYRCHSRRSWNVVDAILIDENLHITGSQLVCDVL